MARLNKFLLLSLVIASPLAAKTPCPPHKAGQGYPWYVPELMEGDQWADVAIDLDPKGNVTGCKIVKGNLEGDDGFFVCRAMTAQGEFDPVKKDGVAVAGTIQRHMELQGMRHRDANAAARKRWFAAHPDERESCYPD